MVTCCVINCKKRSSTSNLQKDNITFHRFPKDPTIRNIWMWACQKHASWTPTRCSTICSMHFDTSCFIFKTNNKRKLKPSSVPTLNLSKVDPGEESESETSINKIINFETSEYSDLLQTHENVEHLKLQTSQSNTFNPPNLAIKVQLLEESPGKINKLKKCLLMKNKRIKSLQSQVKYLKNKVAEMQEILDELTKIV
ncbi:THAP domain-containing protein 1-like isoform X2 [Ostrinia furnacalis]|uniref:THAP domain-containing protein 1-like isoform X2 n=1 Tax=Ostrinia furnacalis TaxID=93504 RepID=UPI00103D59C9|nr:THAP domain-containing protein 1-like isoform X2 [Ostrinia furnacalis]